MDACTPRRKDTAAETAPAGSRRISPRPHKLAVAVAAPNPAPVRCHSHAAGGSVTASERGRDRRGRGAGVGFATGRDRRLRARAPGLCQRRPRGRSSRGSIIWLMATRNRIIRASPWESNETVPNHSATVFRAVEVEATIRSSGSRRRASRNARARAAPAVRDHGRAVVQRPQPVWH
ncbi:hypothetical protein PVAP13_1NG199019 [Panicum virgatum]|uniref:Uncharacterized protein n=1 Tax=Panicum virgatum TaxID=38727 RepID=A0A8T0WV38_PANVG|nr:hypothetical protein PVAP13_1NG199019 [Panicum virgatum]